MFRTETLSDLELVQKFVKGDKESIEILVHRHKNRVFSYILLIVKNQELAEDIFQETFLKVINSLKTGKYRDKGKFLSWVMRIAHNLIIDHFRREKQANLLSNDDYLLISLRYPDSTHEGYPLCRNNNRHV